MTELLEQARIAAKAIVALATPIITAFVIDAAGELETVAVGWIAAAATAVMVWLVPNKTS